MWFVGVLACREPAQPPRPEEPSTPVPLDSALHTGAPAPTGATGDSATHTGEAPYVEVLCTLELSCNRPIVDAPDTVCGFRVTDGDGTIEYEANASVERRGRSSLSFPKPQYGVELDTSTNLLDMGAERDWVVNGAYIDRALVRNKFGYDLFRTFGGNERWAPETRACTLSLNGMPQGVYFLGEQVERDDDRLDLSVDDGSGATFVVKLEDFGGIVDNTPVGFGSWALVYPDLDDATPGQLQGVQSALLDWQAAVLGPDPSAIFDHVDLESAVDFVLLEELTKNNDAFFLSVHAWRDAGGKLHFTPWDLDLTLGQPTYNDNVNPASWLLYRPTMIARMGDDPTFRARLGERWRELRTGPLADAELLARVDAQLAVMGPALQANYTVWDWQEVSLVWNTLPLVANVDEEVANIRAFLPARTAWIDDNIDTW